MYQELLTIKRDSYCLAKEDITCITDNWALPTSYLEFVQELGFGRLLGLFLTYIPMGKDNNYCDSLERRNAYWKDVFQQYIHVSLSMLKKKENLALLMNAEPFMVSENGEVVFWDVRYPKAGEYPIYLVHFPVGIYFAGYHFREFITRLTCEETYKSILKFHESPLLPTFEPLSVNQMTSLS